MTDSRLIIHILLFILERIEKLADQASVDALTAKVTGIHDALSAAVASIQSELDSLKNANPSVDTTALETAVNSLDPVVAQATAEGSEVPPATPPATA